jgi:hypothetical protein
VGQKISALVDGGPSGGPRVRRPGSEDPHRRERKFGTFLCQNSEFCLSALGSALPLYTAMSAIERVPLPGCRSDVSSLKDWS